MEDNMPTIIISSNERDDINTYINNLPISIKV